MEEASVFLLLAEEGSKHHMAVDEIWKFTQFRCFVLPHTWNGCWEENTSVEAEGLFLGRTPILGFIAQNFSLGGQGHICVPCLMTFPSSSLSSLYQNCLQVGTRHARQFIL